MENKLVTTGKITIALREGKKEEITAVIIGNLFAVHWDHVDKEDPSFTLTHLKSGCALATGFDKPMYALTVGARLYATLSEEQKKLWDFDSIEASKKLPKRHTTAVAKYVARAKKCENNTELEKMVGVFYKDREETERLRLKINPEANTLMDEQAIGSERLTGSLIMGEFKFA